MKILKQKLIDIIKEETLKLLEISGEEVRVDTDTRPHGRRGPSARAGPQGERGFERRKSPRGSSGWKTRKVDISELPDIPDIPDRPLPGRAADRRSGAPDRRSEYRGVNRRSSASDPVSSAKTQPTVQPVADPHAPQKKPSRWQRFSKSKLGRGLGRLGKGLGAPAAAALTGYEAYNRTRDALGPEGFDIPLVGSGIAAPFPGADKVYDKLGLPTSAHVSGLDMLPDTGEEGVDFSPREIGAGLKQGWKELTGQQRDDEKSLYRRWLDSAKQEEGIIRENKEKTRLLILAGIKRN